jgi:hypothetical protein
LPAYGTPRALGAIAGMLERMAGGDSTSRPIAAMRRAIQDLERLGGVDLDRADHVKEALEQGIEATRAFARARGAEWLEPWEEAAANAVGAIDPASPLGLQRSAVQDALRSLADAVLVAEQFADRLADEPARGAPGDPPSRSQAGVPAPSRVADRRRGFHHCRVELLGVRLVGLGAELRPSDGRAARPADASPAPPWDAR